MSGSKQPKWRTEHTICSYDVDPCGIARLSSLCRFMQEAAYHHAEHLGLGHVGLSDKGLAWVLARQRITTDQLPTWGGKVKIRTWPSGRDRLFFYRDFEITGEAGDPVLRSTTAWFVIDIGKRERVHSDIYLSTDLPPVICECAAKPVRLKGSDCSFSQPVTVDYGDLDMNGHVNNVRYIEWILNSLPLEFHQSHMLKELQVNYLTEALYDDRLSVCRKETEPLRFAHAIRNGGEELFRARSVWA
jgi:acyl-ACP thioesterase